ncbi:CocE/NonD family hydrolase [Lutimonas sp.]|uniref:CocE/NonD family hydrolase n=1 Tax=Lutimonas sp. TaxID=1872403 RepID=UPI003D9BCE0A
MKQLFELLIIALINLSMVGQELQIEKAALSDTAALTINIQNLAQDYLQLSQKGGHEIELYDRYMIQILAGDYQAAIETIESLRENSSMNNGHPAYMPYDLFSNAKMAQLVSGRTFEEEYQSGFSIYLKHCNDAQAYSADIVFITYDAVAQYTNSFKTNYNSIPDTSVNLDQAKALLKSYFLYHVYSLTEPIVQKEIKSDENRRYIIKEALIVSPRDGAELSVITARKRNSDPMPAVLDFTIYVEESNEKLAILAASKGYAGVVVNSRGKRQSKDAIDPFKHEFKDVYAAIDWISKQKWSNAKVGMYGGSYDGFSQWASMKEKVHPALKTIVPMVSIAPGIDYPMENNIFYNFPYKWIPYATNNKLLDKAANFDRQRWNDLEHTWFASGAAFRKMDSIEGISRPLFQEWISHPSYDNYWQKMIPYKEEFSHIDIPILSITGYYDDSQRGAMYYYQEHLEYKPDAEHYLLIGPYDHWSAQSRSGTNLRGYQIDEVAHLNIRHGLAYEWFDHILKGKRKPALLKDKVNFQVMGANTWMHKPSLSAMTNASLDFYLGNEKSAGHYTLLHDQPAKGTVQLEVNLADRSTMNNTNYYPWPIIKDSINLDDGLVFISEPIQKEMILNGSFTGELLVESNKKDFDYSVVLYERTSEGRYFQLSFYIGRASFAKYREQRELLIPNKLTTIKFDNTRISAKKISKNSRIVVVINGNKNSYGQINYGTGGDVSSESIRDATLPLQLIIDSRSKITLPIWNEK